MNLATAHHAVLLASAPVLASSLNALAGLAMKAAGAIKNALAAAMNPSAVLVFAFSADVRWAETGILAAGAVIGSLVLQPRFTACSPPAAPCSAFMPLRGMSRLKPHLPKAPLAR